MYLHVVHVLEIVVNIIEKEHNWLLCTIYMYLSQLSQIQSLLAHAF